QTIPSSSSDPLVEHYTRNHLIVEDVEILATPDLGATQVNFRARHTVQAKPGFHAHSGSKVRLYTGNSLPECYDLAYYFLADAGGDEDVVGGSYNGDAGQGSIICILR